MKKKPVRGMPGGEEKGLRKVKAVAVALLLLAMTCVALALWAGNRQTAVQGPWGLAVLRAGQVWLRVNAASTGRVMQRSMRSVGEKPRTPTYSAVRPAIMPNLTLRWDFACWQMPRLV